jgi:glyoxylase-like metal-dependent hydrolase (beta-lactamase superfamily II)
MTIPPVQRWNVGAVRITRVVESEIAIPPAFMFGDAELPVLEKAAWLRPHFVNEKGALVTSIHAFVVDDGTRRIVVDTCVGNDKVRNLPFWNQMHGPFLEQLAEAGCPVESVDTVLCTHLHIDHVGWNTRLVNGRWVPTFPNARYLFARTEWEHWSKQPPEPGEDIIGDSVRPIVDAELADLVECDHRVSDSVWLEPTPGHTPGHVSVRIRSNGADAVITGDLMHHPLQIADPEIGATFDVDSARARATRREFLDRYANADVLVLGTHFATPTGGRIVADAAGRRMET